MQKSLPHRIGRMCGPKGGTLITLIPPLLITKSHTPTPVSPSHVDSLLSTPSQHPHGHTTTSLRSTTLASPLPMATPQSFSCPLLTVDPIEGDIHHPPHLHREIEVPEASILSGLFLPVCALMWSFPFTYKWRAWAVVFFVDCLSIGFAGRGRHWMLA